MERKTNYPLLRNKLLPVFPKFLISAKRGPRYGENSVGTKHVSRFEKEVCWQSNLQHSALKKYFPCPDLNPGSQIWTVKTWVSYHYAITITGKTALQRRS